MGSESSVREARWWLCAVKEKKEEDGDGEMEKHAPWGVGKPEWRAKQ